jgi:hypothetical protein
LTSKIFKTPHASKLGVFLCLRKSGGKKKRRNGGKKSGKRVRRKSGSEILLPHSIFKLRLLIKDR